MADFAPSFQKMIRNEGGFTLHKVAGDRGGLTYAGIAEKFHPDWEGWNVVKHNENSMELTQMVFNFYKKHYWDGVKGDDIKQQKVAESIFDFAVNAGVRTASKLAQLVVDSTPDGKIGPKTLERINQANEELFISNYALAKVSRYASIVNNNRSQGKFLLGWINRTLEGLK